MTRQKKIKLTAPKKRALATFVKHFQWMIINQLKPRRRAHPCESGKILIPEDLFLMFKETFDLTGRFKVNETFINFLNMTNSLYINDREFCSYDNDSMQVRVGATRKAKNLDRDLVEKKITNGYFLFSYQFNRRESVI